MQFTSWDNLHSTFTCCGTGIPLPFSKLHRNANGGIGRPRGIVDSMNVPLKGVELLASKQTCSQSFEWTNSNATLKFSGINQTQGMLGESCHILEEGQHSVYNTSLQLVATNRLRVQLSKEFSFDEEKNEFRWHKTWKLPEVRVIYMRPPGSCPESELTAWITCVCRTDLENSFEVLGLEGVTSQPLVDGQCTFSRLRFKSTSSLQRGKPFHLVVSVQKGDKCMDSLISKGIYVYSRKDADKKRKKMDHLTDSVSEITAADKAHAFYVAFSPDLFDRVFFRKVLKMNKRLNYVLIKCNIGKRPSRAENRGEDRKLSKRTFVVFPGAQYSFQM